MLIDKDNEPHADIALSQTSRAELILAYLAPFFGVSADTSARKHFQSFNTLSSNQPHFPHGHVIGPQKAGQGLGWLTASILA